MFMFYVKEPGVQPLSFETTFIVYEPHENTNLSLSKFKSGYIFFTNGTIFTK